MSSRTNIQQLIDSNVYNNLNKEILASMMRTVLEELMNSNFNKTDDELQNIKYNSTQTLAQFFDSLPIFKYANIGPFNIASAGTTVLTVSGDWVTAASIINLTANDSKLVIDFSEVITGRKFIFTHQTTAAGDAGLNENNDVAVQVWREETPTRISIGYRKFEAVTTSIVLNLIII